MKKITIIFVTLLLLLSSTTILAKEKKASKMKIQKNRVAVVMASFLPIYEERKPGSNIVRQATKGEVFDIKRVGKYWVEVSVPPNNVPGWLERGLETKKIDIREKGDKTVLIMNIVYAAIVIAILAVLLFLFRFVQDAKRKKALEDIED